MFATIVIGLVVVGAFALHELLSRQRRAWPGAVVPALLVALIVVGIVRGAIDTPRDYLFALVGLGVLLGMWADGRRRTVATGQPVPRR